MKLSRLIYILALAMTLLGTAESQIVSGKMVTDIRGLIPMQDPYCSAMTTPENPTLCQAVSVGSIPADVVDWVLLELRATVTDAGPAAATDVVARKPAFLLSNGRVVDAGKYVNQLQSSTLELPPFCEVAELATNQNNCPDVEFTTVAVASDKELYLVVRHRNHLDIISSSNITGVADSNKNADLYSYDFSDAENKAYNSAMALKSKGSVFVMYGGDVDNKGSIDVTDYTIGAARSIGRSLYDPGDTNFSGIVTPADYSDIISQNLNKSSQVP